MASLIAGDAFSASDDPNAQDLVSWTFGGNVPADRRILMDAEDDGVFLTYGELQTTVKRAMAGLHHEGIKYGDCVMVNAFNSVYYYVLYLAIAGAGAVFTGVNPGHTSAEIEHHMRLAKPKLVVVEPELLIKTFEAGLKVGNPKMILFNHADPSPKPGNNWASLMGHGERPWLTTWRIDIVPASEPLDAIAQLATTSGTSGLPKLAAVPHAYHVDQARFLRDRTAPEDQYPVRRLLCLPPFHTFATPIVPASIRGGVPVWVMRRFDADRFCAHVERFGISESYLAPQSVAAIARTGSAEGLRSLRQIWWGGAPCPAAVRETLRAVLHPDAMIQPVWGMTEAGWISAGMWPERHDGESVGRLLPGCKIKVIDDGGIEVPEGDKGQLVVLSPHPMLWYIDNPGAMIDLFDRNRWIRTGDVGYLLGGKVFVVDRVKDVIKVRGWQVSPAEVEAALRQHPDVEDAAAVGVPAADGSGGEAVKAFVVPRPGAFPPLDGQAVREFARGRLAGYKVPAMVQFVDSIPRSTAGKVLRRMLRDYA